MDLYFKPYPCCRWAHPAIDACLGLMAENSLQAQDIAQVTIHTFKRATMLSKIIPQTADEAQYNIAWPVAAALVYGDFGMEQVREENLGDPSVVEMMKKLSFAVDENLDARFPGERICKAEVLTTDGRRFLSAECEPRGEAKENIGVEWLCDKFRRITAPVLTEKGQQTLLALLTGEADLPIRVIVDTANEIQFQK